MRIPQHVAIILDGNGRWAKSKGMPRNYGHAQGSKNVERICEEAWRMGIKYLTVYAFSTENWNRPDDEVNALMKLLRNYMKTCLKTAAKNDMKVSAENALKGPVCFPSRIEQESISAFFSVLDNLITLHQRKGKAAVSGCSNDANNSKGVCCKARDFGYKCHKKDEPNRFDA